MDYHPAELATKDVLLTGVTPPLIRRMLDFPWVWRDSDVSTAVASTADGSGYVASRPYGGGGVVYLGINYFDYDDNWARILANAIDRSVAFFADFESRFFTRGDVQTDGQVNIAAAAAGINFLFASGEAPRCLDAMDSNDDGRLNIADPVHLLNYLFAQGETPPAPGPTVCGLDRTPDDDIGCDAFPLCD